MLPNSVKSIGEYAFSSCELLASVTIPKSVTAIAKRAFYCCYKLADVYCYAEDVIPASSDAFEYSHISSIGTLHVPEVSLEDYQTTAPWSNFQTFEALLPEHCATPTISFTNGKLMFECETEGVEYVYSFSSDAFKTSNGSDIPLAVVLHVSVYATKEGCVDSDVATTDINLNDVLGDADGDGEITIADVTTIINTILNSDKATD